MSEPARFLPSLVNEESAARQLGISKADLARARLGGQISYVRMGKRMYRYAHEDLAAYERKLARVQVDALLGIARRGREELNKETGVYLLWRGTEVVYVGRTATFHTRLATHILSKEFDAYSFVPVPPELVGIAEVALIRHLRPKLNVQFVPEDEP